MSLINRIEKNLDIEDYHASEGISNSGIGLMLDCPARYYFEYVYKYEREISILPNGVKIEEDEEEIKAKEWAVTGQAVHTLSLEPDDFDSRFLVMPKLDRRRTEDKLIYNKLLLSGKTLLKPKQAQIAWMMAESMLRNSKFKKILQKGGNIEHSLFWQNPDGIILRSRPDFYNDFMIVDVKTTVSVDPHRFATSIAEYGYHRQAALALDLLSALTGREYKYFAIIAVEKKWPYLSEFFQLDQNSIDIGRHEYLKGLQDYKVCKERDLWPSYTSGLHEIELPRWYKTKY